MDSEKQQQHLCKCGDTVRNLAMFRGIMCWFCPKIKPLSLSLSLTHSLFLRFCLVTDWWSSFPVRLCHFSCPPSGSNEDTAFICGQSIELWKSALIGANYVKYILIFEMRTPSNSLKWLVKWILSLLIVRGKKRNSATLPNRCIDTLKCLQHVHTISLAVPSSVWHSSEMVGRRLACWPVF